MFKIFGNKEVAVYDHTAEKEINSRGVRSLNIF